MNATRAQARLSDVPIQMGVVVYAKCDNRACVRKQKNYSASLSYSGGVYTPRARKHICRTASEVLA